MIYGLLWLALAGYLVFRRRSAHGAVFKFDLALAGVGIGAAAWFCHLTGLDLGFATLVLNWATLGMLPVLIGWITFREIRSLHLAERIDGRSTHFLSGAVLLIILIAAFTFAPMAPTQGLGVGIMIGGAILIVLLSIVIGRHRKA